jgi:hypothetical protein
VAVTADHAYEYRGPRVYVEGVPFGSWMNPGDRYVSGSPMHEDDVELVPPLDPAAARAAVETAAIEDEDVVEHLVGALTHLGAPRVWVLLRCAYERPNDSEPPEAQVLGVYASEAGLLARLGRIKLANPQYPLETVGPHQWRIGPDEDQGLFGHRDYRLWAVQFPLVP